MDSPDDGRRINSFSVIVKCGAVGEAVVAKNTSMSSLRRTRIYGQRWRATGWLAMRYSAAHPVSQNGGRL